MSYNFAVGLMFLLTIGFIAITHIIFHLGEKLIPKKDKKISVSKKKLNFIKKFLCKVEEDCCEGDKIKIYKLPFIIAIINYIIFPLLLTSFVLLLVFYGAKDYAYDIVSVLFSILTGVVVGFDMTIYVLFEKKAKEKKEQDQEDEMNFK